MKNIRMLAIVLLISIPSICHSLAIPANAILNQKPLNAKNDQHFLFTSPSGNGKAAPSILPFKNLQINGEWDPLNLKSISQLILPIISGKNAKLEKSADEKFLDSKADLVIKNGKEIYEKLVKRLLPFVEGTASTDTLKPGIYDEKQEKHLTKLLENGKKAAEAAFNFCKKPHGQLQCQKWWHSYRQKWTTFVNTESTEIRMNYVQWLKQWIEYFDALRSPISFPHGFIEWPFAKLYLQNIKREFENLPQEKAQTFPVKLRYNKFFEQNEYPEDLYHAEIEVHGVLFSFGDNRGIYNYSKEEKAELIKAVNKNEKKQIGQPKEIIIEEIELGETHFTAGEVQEIIDQLGSTQFAPGKYKLSENNCQHFAGQFADILLGRHPLEKWPAFIHSDRHLSVNPALELFKIAQNMH